MKRICIKLNLVRLTALHFTKFAITLDNIIWRNKIRQILATAKFMLRQIMLHQNIDTPNFSEHNIPINIKIYGE